MPVSYTHLDVYKRQEYIMAMNARIMDRPLVVEEKRLNFEPETPESDVVRAQ